MTIKLQIGDAFRQEEIDSRETLDRIRKEARRQGFRVSPKHGVYPAEPEMLLLDMDGDLVWTDGADPEVQRIVSVSDLLGQDEEPQGHPTVTRVLNGETWELPAPETEAPEVGTKYCVPKSSAAKDFGRRKWVGDGDDEFLLGAGFVHLTPENAKPWTKFFRAAAKGGE